MSDYLVDLYKLNDEQYPEINGVRFVRVLSPNSDMVVKFVEENFSKFWASEVKASLYKNNPSCFIAVRGTQIVGFAAYDATCKGFFGPTGVLQSERGNGIGSVLLRLCLKAMKEEGYAYAVIGSSSDRAVKFYQRNCNAIEIPDSSRVYSRLIK